MREMSPRNCLKQVDMRETKTGIQGDEYGQ